MNQSTTQKLNNSPTQQFPNSTPSTPNGYYARDAAMLVAACLVKKIQPYCKGKPRIIGALAAGKAAVIQIEISCCPVPSQELKPPGVLIPVESDHENMVTESLASRYKLEYNPVAGPRSSVSFDFMTIPVTIHFKKPDDDETDS